MSAAPGAATLMTVARTQSAPGLPSSRRLRDFAAQRGRLQSVAGRSKDSVADAQGFLDQLNEVDLKGGNGRWRQRLAQAEFERRQARDREELRQKRLAAEKRRRWQAQREEKHRKHLEEMWKERASQQERLRVEANAREERRRADAERERLRKEGERRQWLERQPKECSACEGAGACPCCLGKGLRLALFLVPVVSKDTPGDHGKLPQGCEACGGRGHNVQDGGRGQLWPAIVLKRNRGAEEAASADVGAVGSEASPTLGTT
eukprot:CAMPEP_0176073742 /NCGR_PEP_ID=MMETSP0120_2-20121206/36847_1 /TAXON_ID=160619 /ORGANISM="Kryptoperidinium foliaceum, Strain CCMP 1326" /LENGTH=261 /DNA_ID=CAMNT_0017407427 /DNA_START=74 /DNA_END=856 /DNA_ORIENTATION=-